MDSSTSSSQIYRILEVTLKCAKLYTKKKAKRYVKIWIEPDVTITTKIQRNPNQVVCDEKFVFPVPDHFLNNKDDDDSTVTFEFYEARKFFQDSLIGTTVCKVGVLSVTDSDDDDDDDSSDNEEDRVMGLETMRGNKKVMILGNKGLKVKGEMDVEMEVWNNGYISSCVGNCRLQSWVMRYDDLMEQRLQGGGAASDDDDDNESVRMKTSWNCFAHSLIITK